MTDPAISFRIGQGFDVHAFCEGDHVTLGGVRIDHSQGLAAHSDGDVAIHALCDALLGTLALGDIGKHFPPDDARWSGVDSRELLRAVRAMLAARGALPVNCDLTIICERPRIGPHVELMQQRIALDLGISPDCVSIKATTTERLGFTGRGEGIAAMAIAMVQR